MNERRWNVCGLGMVRRPIETAPASVKLCWVDCENGPLVVARCRDGVWDNATGRALRIKPTHWTIWETEDPLATEGADNGKA